MEDFKHLLTLGDADFKMILEGLEALKSKDFSGKMMGMMFKTMLKPKDDDPIAKAKWEEHEKEEQLKEIAEEIKLTKMREEIDLLKAKIVIVLDMKRRQETKSPKRQIEKSNQ